MVPFDARVCALILSWLLGLLWGLIVLLGLKVLSYKLLEAGKIHQGRSNFIWTILSFSKTGTWSKMP